MIGLFRYNLLKELKNFPTILIVTMITMIVSFLENISEITLLVLLVISTDIYSGNEKENKDLVIFQTIIPISIFNQLKSCYLFLIFKTLILMLVYVSTYFMINRVIDDNLIFQLMLFFSISLSIGAVVIHKNIMENQIRKASYYLIVALQLVQSTILDILNTFFDFSIPTEKGVVLIVCMNLIFYLVFFAYSLFTVKKFRRKKYATHNL